jgi:hypothetical protein
MHQRAGQSPMLYRDAIEFLAKVPEMLLLEKDDT